jgi:hypothetical protein
MRYGVVLALAGCGGTEQGEDAHDAIDDTFVVDGKADTGGIVEGTVEAKAVLKAASFSSLAELLDPQGASLYAKAAEAIVAHRDKKGGPFATLAELDAVPYVGPVAFWKLVDWADRAGFLAVSGMIYREGEPLHLGDVDYLLVGEQLLKQRDTVSGSEVSTAVLWQLHVKADRLAYDAAADRLIALGPKKLYLVTPGGQIEKSFDEGYADLPQLGGTFAAGVCAVYQNMGATYRGKALGAFMIGNLFLGYGYQYWAATFETLFKLYC